MRSGRLARMLITPRYNGLFGCSQRRVQCRRQVAQAGERGAKAAGQLSNRAARPADQANPPRTAREETDPRGIAEYCRIFSSAKYRRWDWAPSGRILPEHARTSIAQFASRLAASGA